MMTSGTSRPQAGPIPRAGGGGRSKTYDRVHLTLETPPRPLWEKGSGDVDVQRLLVEGVNLPKSVFETFPRIES